MMMKSKIRALKIVLMFHYFIQKVACLAAPSDERIYVWDNVMSAASCATVHEVASATGLSHKLMIRNGEKQQQPLSPLEQALENILQNFNDTSRYVEYWCRQEWRHIESHADVDEYRAKQVPGDFRYPTNGHVLYLQVGTLVRGPTCLFPNCSSGGDLQHLQGQGEERLSVLTVPAVEGRLLRFPGHWLHTVPRPTDLWLLSFVKGSPDFSKEYQRSVVLFNTWNDEEPPLEVPILSKEGSDSSCDAAEHQYNLVNPYEDWQEQSVLDSRHSTSSSSSLPLDKKTKIWLLGDAIRRNHTLRTVTKYSNEKELRDALHEASQPRSTLLAHSPVLDPSASSL